ncbi:serine hydrolase domain-containing protein [Aureitalea marina]|uniref:Beta-lactamase-related domain-containing protein n=1 Tax=Aureitalea marina TaxID=930804 RepID=A0A2S7KT38_9FLAO|nr:serine hydrolase domain-containing protein [Aureitalea marina]PQB05703.1 hypothetical protein BST85_12940 [Aureitalea marina]
MRISYLSLIATLFVFTQCTSPKEEDSSSKEVEELISRVENGLQPFLQIGEDSLLRYNIEDRLKELGIPGVSIAVMKNGELQWAKGYGMADIASNRAVNSQTMFLAGSISKPVAATRAHQLAEAGTISLDTDVNEYLSSWKLPENEFTVNEKVTTRRILNHTAGLTVWGFPGYDKGDTIPSAAEVLDGLGNTDSVRVYKEPGESWMYSGGGYTIMQLMITDIEGQKYPEIMQTNVLDPLGMEKSTYENPLPEKYHGIAATGYRSNGDEVEGKWPIYPEMAAAGLWTTPSQLIQWAGEMQQILQTQEDGLLKTATVNEMVVPGMNDYGLGPAANEYTFSHGGADEGFRAQLTAWKKEPIAIVVMVNSDNGSIIQEIMLSVAREYGLPDVEARKRVVNEISEEQQLTYEGKYQFPEWGEAIIRVKDNGLEITGEFGGDEPIFLLPEKENTFFNQASGTYYEFVFEDDKVIRLDVAGREGTKVE